MENEENNFEEIKVDESVKFDEARVEAAVEQEPVIEEPVSYSSQTSDEIQTPAADEAKKPKSRIIGKILFVLYLWVCMILGWFIVWYFIFDGNVAQLISNFK